MNKKDKPSYNETLIHFIKKNVFFVSDEGGVRIRSEFKNRFDEFRVNGKNTKISILGKDGIWLSKELDKWKKKIYSKERCSFNGTIQNLEVLCELTNSTPNNLLLSHKEIIDKCGDEVEYITKDTIVEIAEKIKNDNTLLEDDLLLPVKSRPQRMVTLFVKFYRTRGYSKDIQVCHLISEYGIDDGIMTYSNETEDSQIVNLSDSKKSRVPLNKMLEYAEEQYDLACKSFKEECVDDFYVLEKLTRKRDGDLLLSMISADIIMDDSIKTSVDDMINKASSIHLDRGF